MDNSRMVRTCAKVLFVMFSIMFFMCINTELTTANYYHGVFSLFVISGSMLVSAYYSERQ